jgi:hypothetical protein
MNKVFLALYDHKHGQDMSAHTTEQGAFNQCAQWARNGLQDMWNSLTSEEYKSYSEMSDDDLVACWSKLTGWTEFFKIENLNVQGEN